MLGVFRVNERTREIYGRIFRSEIWEAPTALGPRRWSVYKCACGERGGPLREDACRRLLDLVNSRRDFGTGIPQEFYNSIFGNRLKRRFLLVENRLRG